MGAASRARTVSHTRLSSLTVSHSSVEWSIEPVTRPRAGHVGRIDAAQTYINSTE